MGPLVDSLAGLLHAEVFAWDWKGGTGLTDSPDPPRRGLHMKPSEQHWAVVSAQEGRVATVRRVPSKSLGFRFIGSSETETSLHLLNSFFLTSWSDPLGVFPLQPHAAWPFNPHCCFTSFPHALSCLLFPKSREDRISSEQLKVAL